MLVGKVSLVILWSATMALASPNRRGNYKGTTGKRSSFGSHRQACSDQIKKLSSDLVGAAKVHNTFNFDQHCSLSVEAIEGFSPKDLADFLGVTGVDIIKVVVHGRGIQFPVPPPGLPQPLVGIARPRQGNHRYLQPPPSAYRNMSFAPHVESEVHLMHNLGLLGDSNVSVCLVDTGVDYTNWRLGGGFGKGFKIAMGHDFVGNDGKHPGPFPYTTCTDHGTHVTGIVGANFDYNFKFSGAAPGVTLGHYRAFACTGQSSEDTIAAALLRAHADGCKVITLSLGGPSAWEDGLVADAASHVTNQGSLVVSSAGNFGTQGLFYGDVPGELPEVLGTAATDLREYPVGYLVDIIAHPSVPPIPYFAVFPVNINETLDVYYIPRSITDDPKCKLSTLALPSGGLKNSLLVLELGQCPHSLLAKWAVANKLRVAMVSFNPEDVESPLNYYSNHFVRGIDYFLIVHPSWVETLIGYHRASRGQLQVSFASGKRASVEALANHESGGSMAFYSSYGPTATLEGFGKTLAAPGTNILSTLTVARGGVGVMSGTSMACPLAAGIAALLFSHRKADNLTPRQVKSLMATTARPVRIRQGPTGAFATVVQQGGGIVSAYRAYIAKTLIEPHSIALGDLEHFNNSHSITLKNTNEFAVTYTLSSTSSQTVTTYDKSASIDINPSAIPRPGIAGTATVAFTPRSLTIPPGQSGTFTATFTFPNFPKKDFVRVPVVSGWILIDSAEDPVPTYRIAFAGVATGLQVMPVLDSTDVASQLYGIKGLRHPFIMVGSSLDPNLLPSTATDVLSDPNKVTTLSRIDGISVFLRFAMATRYLQADLVDANTTFIPTIPSNNNLHLAEDNSLTGDLQKRPHNPPLFASVSILGTLTTAKHLTRDPTEFSHTSGADTSFFNFNGMVAAKHPDDPATTSVDKGRPYRFLVRALRLDSDPKLSASYDSWLSPPFQFLD